MHHDSMPSSPCSLPRGKLYTKPAPRRLWIAHTHLFMLAFSHQRCKYEEVRASYNSVRPPGSLKVPPFEEFRGVSDICDHTYCR